MAHHSSNESDEMRRLLGKAFQQPLGATGRFPEGKLTQDDEGEIAIAIGAAPDGTVVMDFGKPTAWIGFKKAQAIEIADTLRKHAGEAPIEGPRLTLNDYAALCHKANEKWWTSMVDGSRLERNKGELLMLMVSEIAEAMEGERKNLPDDKLPHRRMAEVELVDALIRIFDYAGAFGYDLEGAFREKMAFNAQREDHKHEARALANGKKW